MLAHGLSHRLPSQGPTDCPALIVLPGVWSGVHAQLAFLSPWDIEGSLEGGSWCLGCSQARAGSQCPPTLNGLSIRELDLSPGSSGLPLSLFILFI